MSVMVWAALSVDADNIKRLERRILELEEQLEHLTQALQNYLKVTLK
jgi:hypothetical protein